MFEQVAADRLGLGPVAEAHQYQGVTAAQAAGVRAHVVDVAVGDAVDVIGLAFAKEQV